MRGSKVSQGLSARRDELLYISRPTDSQHALLQKVLAWKLKASPFCVELSVLPVPLPVQSVQVRSTGSSTLPIGVNMSVNGGLSLC